MLAPIHLLLLVLVAGGCGYWLLARDYKLLALSHARRRCGELGLQLLDQSVVLKKMRLYRSERGSLAWKRSYVFEFSSTGNDRYTGRLTLAGRTLLSVDMDVHVIG